MDETKKNAEECSAASRKTKSAPQVKAERAKKRASKTEKVATNAFLKVWATVVSTMDDRISEITERLHEEIFVNRMLLCDAIESVMGDNPLDISRTLLLYEVYYHNSIASDMPGTKVEEGIIYDADGNELPKEDAYFAREQGQSFFEVLNQDYLKQEAKDYDTEGI